MMSLWCDVTYVLSLYFHWCFDFQDEFVTWRDVSKVTYLYAVFTMSLWCDPGPGSRCIYLYVVFNMVFLFTMSLKCDVTCHDPYSRFIWLYAMFMMSLCYDVTSGPLYCRDAIAPNKTRKVRNCESVLHISNIHIWICREWQQKWWKLWCVKETLDV